MKQIDSILTQLLHKLFIIIIIHSFFVVVSRFASLKSRRSGGYIGKEMGVKLTPEGVHGTGVATQKEWRPIGIADGEPLVSSVEMYYAKLSSMSTSFASLSSIIVNERKWAGL